MNSMFRFIPITEFVHPSLKKDIRDIKHVDDKQSCIINDFINKNKDIIEAKTHNKLVYTPFCDIITKQLFKVNKISLKGK